MNYIQRPYHSETDLPAVLALKQLCTTPENLYDRPTTGEMRRLLTPLTESTTRTIEKHSRAEALRGMSQEQRHRALTQRLTALPDNLVHSANANSSGSRTVGANAWWVRWV